MRKITAKKVLALGDGRAWQHVHRPWRKGAGTPYVITPYWVMRAEHVEDWQDLVSFPATGIGVAEPPTPSSAFKALWTRYVEGGTTWWGLTPTGETYQRPGSRKSDVGSVFARQDGKAVVLASRFVSAFDPLPGEWWQAGNDWHHVVLRVEETSRGDVIHGFVMPARHSGIKPNLEAAA